MENIGIVNIGIEHIHPHPDNPRKNLGDLTELSESLKKNGVMQNLTVIPIDGEQGEYYALIGNRRSAAARLAGLTELPSKIVEGMSKKDQVSIMLEENMQRDDLTILEQAQGFQMMLDLGETEETIAEKTGFSKATIRHRLNIAKLDQKELNKKEQDDSFQLTLKDLYALEKVEDIKTRNKILKEARNSSELIWKAQNAANEAERAKKVKIIADMLEKLGVEKAPKGTENELYTTKWTLLKEFDLEKSVPKKIVLKETGKIFYLPYYRSVKILMRAQKGKKVLTPEEEKRKQKDKAMKEIKARIKEMNANRREFVENIISGKIDSIKDEVGVRKKIWEFLFEAGWYLSRSSMKSFFTGKEDYKCTPEEKEEAEKRVKSLSFTQSMLVAMHSAACGMSDIFDWQGYYRPEIGSVLIHAYQILRLYGWTFANDDDEQLLDGTHELYTKKDTEK